MRTPLLALALVACNADPGEVDQQVDYRLGAPEEGAASSGERGTIVISEVLWSGAIGPDGVRDQSDIFIELRNESARSVNLSGWHLKQQGSIQRTYRIPESTRMVAVGEHVIIAATADGCFPTADYVIPELELPDGDPFYLTLQDADERLIESAGNRTMPPFAGGFDLVDSRSMERVQLMFGGRGTEPHIWHYYTDAETDVPNDTYIDEGCRAHTLASPRRPNSPDYSGAYSTGSFE